MNPKKLLPLAILMAMIILTAVPASAYYDGVRDQQNYVVPKVNPENPAIVIDGVVDLEKEWAGALHNDIDLTKKEGSEEITLWDPNVWDASVPVMITQENGWDDLPDDLKCTWNYYYLWSDTGLYIAVTCDNDKSYPAPLDITSYMGDNYDANKANDRHSFMITPYDNLDNGNGPGWMYWYYAWAGYLEVGSVKSLWIEGQTTGWDNFSNNPKNLDVKVAAKRSAKPDEKGNYPYAIELYIPWDGLKYDQSGSIIHEFTPKEGWTFMLGAIGENRTGDVTYYIRGTKAQGWMNYDYYKLGAPVPKIAAETPEEEPAETPKEDTNPVTSDTACLIYGLAAVLSSAVFVAVKTRIRQ